MHRSPACADTRSFEPARRPPRLRGLCALALFAALGAIQPEPARAAGLTFHEQSLDLPGAPAALIPADLDGDGLRDLVVVVVYTEWDQIGIEEMTTMDQVEGLVEVLTIVPTLLDRREVRAYRGLPGGGFALAGEPLALPLDVLSMAAGPPGVSVVALTDAGASALRLDEDGTLRLEPLVEDPSILAGTGSFLADLPLVADVTGDGIADLLLPAADGIAIHPGRDGSIAPEAIARVPYPKPPAGKSSGGSSSGTSSDAALRLDVPLPEVLDADGDGLPDLLFRETGHGFGSGLDGATVALQTAPGRFSPPAEVANVAEVARRVDAPAARASEGAGGGKGEDGKDDRHREGDRDRVWIGPVDAAAGAELVETDSLDDEDAGMRKEMQQAREPRFRVRVHALGRPSSPAAPATPAATGLTGPTDSREAPALVPTPTPSETFEVKGWVTDGAGGDDGEGNSFVLPGGFQDLNGDGRADLVTVTNDITLFKAVSILATRHLTLELGFLAWCQRPDGGFTRAPGEPLTSKLTINLNDLRIRQRSLFAGDFDGDGRLDFLQLGRSREVGIHLGRADCSYPERPDATIRLRDPLRDLALADALDLDGDGKSDLAITQPQPVDEPGVSPPVRLDLYLSRRPGPAQDGTKEAAP